MPPSNIRDILVSFSPSLDLFAISIGDGRIKVWDTGKGQLQTEFSDLSSTLETNRLEKSGHLSVDYTCMKWFYLDKTKKRKRGSSMLVLGTQGGDVLALDVSEGQLKWRINDCHPGGVNAVSFHANTSHVYTAGADGVVCNIHSISGKLLSKFSAASKSIYSLAISPDGKKIATAASQLRIFNCSDQKKLQKFSGHPEQVRCMVFSEDSKYVLSAASNERYVAIWKIDGSKNRQVTAILSMDHPAVFLDIKSTKNEDNGDDATLSVLAVSETGVGYFWHGNNIDALQNCKPTKIYVPQDDTTSKNKAAAPCVFLAKLQNIVEPASCHIFLAYGLLIKPTFLKVVVQSGKDVTLSISRDGILLPISQPEKPKKASQISNQFTTLDRSNMESGLLPVPRIFNPTDKKFEAMPMESKDVAELDSASISVEERLRSLGIISSINETAGSLHDSNLLKSVTLDTSTPHRKVKATVSSMEPNDAINLLKNLIKAWQTRSHDAECVIPWIHSILVHHRDYIKLNDASLLNSLYKVAESRASSMNSLLQLSGRLQLVLAQVERASNNENMLHIQQKKDGTDNKSDDEDEEDEIDDVFRIEDASETSSDDAD